MIHSHDSATSCLLHPAVRRDEVSREESVNAVLVCMMRSKCQHVDDAGGRKSGCVYSCRLGSLLSLSDKAERCDSLCHVAKAMRRRIILGINHDHHALGNRLM